jgi:hypothetical protein
MGTKVAAKPKGFLLKMRLVAPDGTPFGSRRYRIAWGNKLYPPASAPHAITDRAGSISMLLDGSIETGELMLFEIVNGADRVVWSIPLQIAVDPPLAALPAIAPMPPPPPTTASPQQIVDYQKELARYRSTVLVELRERLQEMLQEWNQVQTVVTTLPLPPSPTSTDSELWAAWVLLSAGYALLSAGYEASWRLWNMALLPLEKEPEFPFFGSDVPKLERALGRFGRKRGDTSLGNLTGVPDALAEIINVHDKRGSLAP